MTKLNRILYVEDEPDIRAVAELSLETVGGFQVLLCASGQEALEVVDDFAPDLVLLDVMMPGMDGPAVLEALRSRPGFAATPVAFMTAKIQPSEVAYYKRLGAIDVISKPFDPMTLPDRIREVWAQYQQTL